MLRRLGLQQAFIIAAIVTMVLAAGAVFQFEKDPKLMLEGLLPACIGIGAVFWALWRVVARHKSG